MHQELMDKPVVVIFRKPTDHDGHTTKSIEGTCGGVTDRLVAVNKITKVVNDEDADITSKVKMKGTSAMVPTNSISFIYATV